MHFKNMALLTVSILVGCLSFLEDVDAQEVESLTIRSIVNKVQPMTGIVLWTDNDYVNTDAIQLEFRYCGYDEVVDAAGNFNFKKIDRILDEVAARKHQSILRFHYVYVGKETTVPAFIKQRSDYKETIGKSEGKQTHFCDWSNEALQNFTLDFYTKFAQRYDNDPRIAFLQTGFGLWAEYHIYDGPNELGKHFPDKAFQSKFLTHLNSQFNNLPWMISVDAADYDYSPLEDNDQLLSLNFGIFDDSFLCKQHPKENAVNWKVLQLDRWKRAPGGGEFSYYNNRDQKLALGASGPNGVSFEKASSQFHISFMIGSDQPRFQSMQRIAEAGMATGYRFRITSAERKGKKVKLTVTNEGVAPIYRDAFFANGNQRSSVSLKGLLPGETRDVELDDPARTLPAGLSIQSDYIVQGQTIQYAADL